MLPELNLLETNKQSNVSLYQHFEFQLAGNALYKTGITYFFTIAIVGSCYPMTFRLVTAKEKHEA